MTNAEIESWLDSTFRGNKPHFQLILKALVSHVDDTMEGKVTELENTSVKFDKDGNLVLTLGVLKSPDVTTTDDFTVKTPANKTLVLQQPVYIDIHPDILVPATGAAAPDEAPHTIGGVLRNLKAFDGNATEERLGGSFEIDHRFMYGMGQEAHVHWRPSASSVGTVTWYFDWEYSPPNAQAIPQTTLSVTRNITVDSQYWHFLDSFGNLPEPSTPFRVGGKIGFNIRRTPTTDTYSGDALLEQIALHVPCDTMGSRQPYVK